MGCPARTPRGKWIQAGLRALATGGPDAVRVELLAKDLPERGVASPAVEVTLPEVQAAQQGQGNISL